MNRLLARACRGALLTCLAAVVSTAVHQSALAQGTVVVPRNGPHADGNETLPTAFQSTAFRFQQIVAGRVFAPTVGTIRSIALRPDARALPLGASRLPNMALYVSETTVPALSMGMVFAQNVTRTPTTVFQGGLVLPAQGSVPSGPAPFQIQVPFSQPFTMPTGTSNLLLDFIATDQNPSVTGYSVDAAVDGGTIETVGQSGMLGTGELLRFIAYGRNGSRSITPGGRVELATTSWIAPYPGALLLGLWSLDPPLDLGRVGAPGNFLHVPGFSAVPHAWQPTAIGWAAPWRLPLPNDPSIIGASVWAQSGVIDPPANPLGVVLSHAKHVVIGDTSTDPTQSVVSPDPTAFLGAWPFGSSSPGGAVLELTGTFR